jgi:hypothetical protein
MTPTGGVADLLTAPADGMAPAERAGPAQRVPLFRRDDLALPVLVAGVAVLVWQWSLGRPLFIDEQYLALNVRDRGFLGLTGDLDYNQSAPLGWLWTQWTIMSSAGVADRVLRFLPLIFGLATLATAWLVGRRWLGLAGTATLLALCATNPYLVRYATEFKAYSADACAVLVLIGSAAAVLTRPAPRRGAWAWWSIAAVAGWFSMAAILVTPGLGLVLVVTILRRHGWRSALEAGLAGVIWLFSFALHYLLALRHAAGDPFFVDWFDGSGFPARSAGLWGLASWVADRPAALVASPLALSPALTVPLWVLVMIGIAAAGARRLAYGALLAVPIVSGFALALLRVAPLDDRLALWLVPVLFLAVAVAADGIVIAIGAWWRRRRGLAVGASVLAGALAVGAGMAVWTPATEAVRPMPTRDLVDDREAVDRIDRIHRPGDVLLVMKPSIYAVHWYGQDRLPVRAFVVEAAGPGCDPAALRGLMAGQRRALVYIGHKAGPVPYKAVTVARLAELGDVMAVPLGDGVGGPGAGVLYLVDLTSPPADPPDAPILRSQPYTCIRLE